MLRFPIMESASAVVVLRVQVLLFGHFQKAQMLRAFVIIGRLPESGVIENQPGKLAREGPGKRHEASFRFFPPFASGDKGGRRLAGEFGDFAEKFLDRSAEGRSRRGLTGGLFFSASAPVYAARLEDGGRPPGV